MKPVVFDSEAKDEFDAAAAYSGTGRDSMGHTVPFGP